jgi:hypothetical protein
MEANKQTSLPSIRNVELDVLRAVTGLKHSGIRLKLVDVSEDPIAITFGLKYIFFFCNFLG